MNVKTILILGAAGAALYLFSRAASAAPANPSPGSPMPTRAPMAGSEWRWVDLPAALRPTKSGWALTDPAPGWRQVRILS